MYIGLFKWKSKVADNFKVINAVKEGGALSPVVFGVYIDMLLDDLIRHKYEMF